MNKITLSILGLALLGTPLGGWAQSGLTLVSQQLPDADNEPANVFPVPTERQLKWNETEFYGFFHYGMNTYTHSRLV